MASATATSARAVDATDMTETNVVAQSIAHKVAVVHTETSCDTYERIMQELADVIAHVLNTPARLRASNCAVEVAQSVGVERISSVMGTRGLMKYESVMRKYEHLHERYNFICDVYYPLRALCHLASNLERGSTIDLSQVMEMVFFAKDAFNRHCTFACGSDHQPLVIGQLCQKLRRVCGPDAKEWTRAAVGAALSTYPACGVTIHEFMCKPAFVRMLHNISEVALSVTVHSKAVENQPVRKAHHANLIERLRQLALDAEAARNTEFRKQLVELHRHVDTFQRVVSNIDARRVERMLQDDSVVHMLQHPPPVFLAALRHADAERCLNTLQPIFDISYPRELRLAQLEEWRTTYAERIVNACERARCELNRAPAFPPQPPLAVRCGTPPQRHVVEGEATDASEDAARARNRSVALPQFVHTHCAREYRLPIVHGRKVNGVEWEALARVARALVSMLEHEDVQPYQCNASIIHSVCMISINEQKYVASLMRGQIDQWQLQHNMDYVLNAEELRAWDSGEYSEILCEACSMLHSTSLERMFEFQHALFDSTGNLRLCPLNSGPRYLLNDIGLRVGRMLADPQHFSRRFVGRAVGMVLPPLMHMREHRALMRNTILGRDRWPKSQDAAEQWTHLHRAYFDYLCTNPLVRERLMTRYRQACLRQANATEPLEFSHDDSRQLPQILFEWMRTVSVQHPHIITLLPTRKRSRAECAHTPRIRIHIDALMH